MKAFVHFSSQTYFNLQLGALARNHNDQFTFGQENLIRTQCSLFNILPFVVILDLMLLKVTKLTKAQHVYNQVFNSRLYKRNEPGYDGG